MEQETESAPADVPAPSISKMRGPSSRSLRASFDNGEVRQGGEEPAPTLAATKMRGPSSRSMRASFDNGEARLPPSIEEAPRAASPKAHPTEDASHNAAKSSKPAKSAKALRPAASPPNAAAHGSSGSVGGDSVGSLDSKQMSINTRNSIRSYIRNERDTILRKWMALEESLTSEDHRREEHAAKRLAKVSRILPISVQKLIGNLKRNVHKTMRDVGGTPFSIIRKMFLHWDLEKNGSLNFSNFSGCLNHLGIQIPVEDLKKIFEFYGRPGRSGEMLMGYAELLSDIQIGEPTVLEFVEGQHEHDNQQPRFEEAADKYLHMPTKVRDFINAAREFILGKMRVEGGTMYYHVRKIFSKYDFDYSSALSPEELYNAGRKDFNMAITLQDAKDIVAFYDRKSAGEMNHNIFANDICSGQPSVFSFEELTPQLIAESKEKLAANAFVKKPYKPPSNRVLEKIKDLVHKSLDYRMFKIGGSYRSWIIETFQFWDPKLTGKFGDWQTLQGAIGRLGVPMSESECKAIYALFDDGRGNFYYQHLMNTLLEGDLGLIADSPAKPKPARQAALQQNSPLMRTSASDVALDLLSASMVKHAEKLSATARAPQSVKRYVEKLRKAVDIYVAKSHGILVPRDFLHGTFMRFDSDHSGKVSNTNLVAAMKELGVNMKSKDVDAFLAWFDCDGSRMFDYGELTKQMYGLASTDKDVRGTFLPDLSSSKGSSLSLSQSFGSKSLPTIPESPQKFIQTVPGPKLEGKLKPIETKLVKEARKRAQREILMQERHKLQERIESIDAQRKKIVEDYRVRHGKEKDK